LADDADARVRQEALSDHEIEDIIAYLRHMAGRKAQ
jgi:hypothetical protein